MVHRLLQQLIFFLLLIIIACHQAMEMTEMEKEKIIKDVRQTLDHYYEDIRTSGLTAEFKYLDHSPDFFWVPPGYSSSLSYDSIVAIVKQNAMKFKKVDNSFDTLQIIPLSKRLATYTGRLKSIMTDTSGQVMAFSIVETGVIIKRREMWRLLHGQTTIIK